MLFTQYGQGGIGLFTAYGTILRALLLPELCKAELAKAAATGQAGEDHWDTEDFSTDTTGGFLLDERGGFSLHAAGKSSRLVCL